MDRKEVIDEVQSMVNATKPLADYVFDYKANFSRKKKEDIPFLPRTFYGLCDNVALIALSLASIYGGGAFALSKYVTFIEANPNLNFLVASAISIGSGAVLTCVLPRIIHNTVLHLKNKLGRYYSKMYVDEVPLYFKKYFNSTLKMIHDGIDLNLLSDSKLIKLYYELKEIPVGYKNIVINYENRLISAIDNKIIKEKKHYNKKILALQNKLDSENLSNSSKVAINQKIERLQAKREDKLKPWLEIHSQCNQVLGKMVQLQECLENPKSKAEIEKQDVKYVEKAVKEYRESKELTKREKVEKIVNHSKNDDNVL